MSVNCCLVFFRAQFGQSRSFNSLSHKNLIMNMEPLVPALPSTNEYEETAADSGTRILLFMYTTGFSLTPSWNECLESHRGVPLRRRGLICPTHSERELTEHLILWSLRQPRLPGDTNCSTLKTLLPRSCLRKLSCLWASVSSHSFRGTLTLDQHSQMLLSSMEGNSNCD